MEKEKSRPNIFPIVIIALLSVSIMLLVLNLGATIFLILRPQQMPLDSPVSDKEPLPAELSSAQGRAALFEKFKEPFNNRDDDKLYALFDPLAQIEATREQFDQEMPNIYKIAGKIESGVYSHYEYMGITQGKKWFNLYYALKTDQGTRILRITVAQESVGSYLFMGFNIATR